MLIRFYTKDKGDHFSDTIFDASMIMYDTDVFAAFNPDFGMLTCDMNYEVYQHICEDGIYNRLIDLTTFEVKFKTAKIKR